MSDIIKLPDNLIGIEDRQRLESFGGHTIAHGRATRWHWGKDPDGDAVFEVYRGGAKQRLAVRIRRDRAQDSFCAQDADGNPIATGALDHVMAELEEYLIRLHGSPADTPA
jgi:hypothetical protein